MGEKKYESDFDNYVFDLYGTLVDIQTDERKLSLRRAGLPLVAESIL